MTSSSSNQASASVAYTCLTLQNNTLPTCLYGDCLNNTCVCWDGYRDDKIVNRYRNCGMNILASHVLCGISIFINIVSLIFGLYVSKYGCEHGTDAQRLAFAVALSGLCFACANSILFGLNFIMPVYGAMFVNVGMATVAFACGIVVHSAAKPVAIFMHFQHVDKVEKLIVKAIPIVLVLVGTLCTIVGHAIGTDRSISLAITSCYIVILFCTLCYLPTFYFLSALIHGLNQAISNNDKSSSSSALESSSNNINNNNNNQSHDHQHHHSPRQSMARRLSTVASTVKESVRNAAASISKTPYITVSDRRLDSHESENVLASVETAEQLRKKAIHDQQRKLYKFRTKVITMRIGIATTSCSLACVSIFAIILDFGFNTFPLSGYLFFAMSIGIGCFSIQMAHYAWNSKGNKGSSSGDEEISSDKHQGKKKKEKVQSDKNKNESSSSSVQQKRQELDSHVDAASGNKIASQMTSATASDNAKMEHKMDLILPQQIEEEVSPEGP